MSFIVFILALLGVIALFTLKSIELHKDSVIFARERREALDNKIIQIEKTCINMINLENAKHLVSYVYNILAHKFAKITASIAKKIEWRARSVAHKSAVAKQNGDSLREQNGYLKDVQEYKDSLDTEKVAEDNKL